jgi:FixJ family two-component response regulator
VIAVVDDEESVRKAVVRVLRASGFSACGFSSGPEFLTSWHFDRPDCLVLDLQMPVCSGAEVQQALKTAGAQFPIVIVTAHDAVSLREQCLRDGAVAYLYKPLDVHVLVQAVTLAIASADFIDPMPKLSVPQLAPIVHGLVQTPDGHSAKL